MKKILLILALNISFICTAIANTDPMYQYQGIYAELNAGISFMQHDDIFFQSDAKTEQGSGYNINSGYQFNHYLALEAGYTGYYAKNTYLNGADVAIKAILPLSANNRVKLFVKAGPGVWFGQRDSEGGLFTGAGLGVGLTQKLDLNLQYQNISWPFGNFGLASVGLTYHFSS